MEKYTIPLFLALVLGYAATPVVRVIAVKIGAIDRPDPRKVHKGLMPRMGGLAVYLAFTAAVIISPARAYPGIWGLLAGATVIVALGILDDTRGLPPGVKLLGQILAALSVIPFGIEVYYITNPLTGKMLFLGVLSVPLTLFWIVAVTNAVNLIDGLDGLAGGVSSIAALTMAAVAWTQWGRSGTAAMTDMVMLSLILVAATLGFLKHNFHPAKIFLGDTGSMFLGFTLAVMSIMSLTKSATAVSVIVPMVILGIPLLDTFFAIIRRYHKHRPIFQPDREHLHHQLMAMGLSHRQTVLVIYGLSAFLGINAVLLNLISSNQALALLAVLAVVVIYSANRLGVLGSSGRAGFKVTEGLKRQGSSKM
ncbi:MraY family glycosyltransferase [Desulfotruncus alcoholivorax]|uniref:MraY family glycosyltransferase n=1 Tax=Desulfotruncus alcoholivorax TaxID=265477 RepID=UPI00047FE860|nr:MraY family glycosyltransferase [Desulfotruncus alcoholivorax]